MGGTIELPRVGEEVDYYPRAGRPGHRVAVVALTPHPLYGALVRFRYVRDGREREVAAGRFHRTPE